MLRSSVLVFLFSAVCSVQEASAQSYVMYTYPAEVQLLQVQIVPAQTVYVDGYVNSWTTYRVASEIPLPIPKKDIWCVAKCSAKYTACNAGCALLPAGLRVACQQRCAGSFAVCVAACP